MKLTTLLIAAATATAAPLNGCGSAPMSNGKHSFTNQGRTRDYWVHVPKGYDRSKPTPVVVLFHGWGYSGAEWVNGGGYGSVSAAPTADKENFILIAPTGLTDSRYGGNCDKGGGYCSWNAAGTSQSPGPDGPTCNDKKQTTDTCYRDTCTDGCNDICSWTTCNDDTTMVHAMLDKIEGELCVDKDRVYAGGESNGGMMTWQMGADSRSKRFAAFVPVIGLPHHGYNFLPSVLPMPIMGIWGSNDRTIPPGSLTATGYTESGDGWYYTTARGITQDWAKDHGCDTSGSPGSYKTSFDGNTGLACTAFSAGCDARSSSNSSTGLVNATAADSAPVVDCRFRGGHVVPSFVPELMWEFFSKHRRNF